PREGGRRPSRGPRRRRGVGGARGVARREAAGPGARLPEADAAEDPDGPLREAGARRRRAPLRAGHRRAGARRLRPGRSLGGGAGAAGSRPRRGCGEGREAALRAFAAFARAAGSFAAPQRTWKPSALWPSRPFFGFLTVTTSE